MDFLNRPDPPVANTAGRVPALVFRGASWAKTAAPASPSAAPAWLDSAAGPASSAVLWELACGVLRSWSTVWGDACCSSGVAVPGPAVDTIAPALPVSSAVAVAAEPEPTLATKPRSAIVQAPTRAIRDRPADASERYPDSSKGPMAPEIGRAHV